MDLGQASTTEDGISVYTCLTGRHMDSFQIFFQKVQIEDRDHDLCLPHVHSKNFPINFCFPSLTDCASMDSTVSYHKSSAYSRTQGQPVQNSMNKAYSTIMKSSRLMNNYFDTKLFTVSTALSYPMYTLIHGLDQTH